MHREQVLLDVTTQFGRYQVVDMVYVGREARVLFSGQQSAAQSAIPLDDNPTMLFDYNQRFLELVESLNPNNILVIGGGAFTLPSAIINNFSEVAVDVVEQDSELPKIAKQYFNLKPNKRLKIIIGDGRKYLSRVRKTYDLIVIDAFMHNVMPHELSTQEFAAILEKRINQNGVVAVNIISSYHGPNDSVLKAQYATYKSIFKHVDVFPADKTWSYWISQNFLLISTNKKFKPEYNLRFETLKPPPVNSLDVQHDQ